jgi:hypothetical protein
MHGHCCLYFHIKNKNPYKTEQKKVNTYVVQFEKKIDYHLSKTELKNKYWINSNCSPFKKILFDTSLIKIVSKIRKLQHQRFFIIHPAYINVIWILSSLKHILIKEHYFRIIKKELSSDCQ